MAASKLNQPRTRGAHGRQLGRRRGGSAPGGSDGCSIPRGRRDRRDQRPAHRRRRRLSGLRSPLAPRRRLCRLRLGTRLDRRPGRELSSHWGGSGCCDGGDGEGCRLRPPSIQCGGFTPHAGEIGITVGRSKQNRRGLIVAGGRNTSPPQPNPRRSCFRGGGTRPERTRSGGSGRGYLSSMCGSTRSRGRYPSRKVRTPKGKVVGNSHPGKPAGKCHRNETADGIASCDAQAMVKRCGKSAPASR